MFNLLTIATCSWIVHEADIFGWGGSIALGVLFWLAGGFLASFIRKN